MSTRAELRQMVAEVPGGGGVAHVGPRTIHQYWHLLAPSFRGILLAPRRRVGEAGISWTWHEAGEGGPVTPAELESVRRRLIAAYGLFFDSCDHDAPLNEDGGVPVELRFAIEDVVNALKACDDHRLVAYVCRTEAGLFVHSWGVTPPVAPREITNAGESQHGSGSSIHEGATGGSVRPDTRPNLRRRRRWLAALLALLLPGLGVGGARWLWWRDRTRNPSPTAAAAEVASGGRNESSGTTSRAGVTTTPTSRGGSSATQATQAQSQAVSAPDSRGTSDPPPQPVTSAARMAADQPTSSSPSTAWRGSGGAAPELPRGADDGRTPPDPLDARGGAVSPARDVATPAGDPPDSIDDTLDASAGASAASEAAKPRASGARETKTLEEFRATLGMPTVRLPNQPSSGQNPPMPSSGAGVESKSQPTSPNPGNELNRAPKPAGGFFSSASDAKPDGGSLPAGVPNSSSGGIPTPARSGAGPSGAIASVAGDHSRAAGTGTGSVSDGSARGSDETPPAGLGGAAGAGGGAVAHNSAARLPGDSPSADSGAETGADEPPEASAGADTGSSGAEEVLAGGMRGIMPVDSGDLGERPPGWSAWRTTVTISVPQLRLGRDAIVPTEPSTQREDRGMLLRLREQVWREREAQIPSVLARPALWHGCTLEPLAAGGGERRWTSRGEGRGVTSSIQGARAELMWPANGFLGPALLVLHDSTGAAVAQVKVRSSGDVVIWGEPAMRVWPWLAIDTSPGPESAEMERFHWRGADAAREAPADGRHRIDAAPARPSKDGPTVETMVFEDAASGWALFIDVEQTAHEPVIAVSR